MKKVLAVLGVSLALASSPAIAQNQQAQVSEQAQVPAHDWGISPGATTPRLVPTPGTVSQAPAKSLSRAHFLAPTMAPRILSEVQAALRQHDLYHGPIDGKWGPQTARAIELYQQKTGLQVTGALDPPTSAALKVGDAWRANMSGNSMAGNNGNVGSSGNQQPMNGPAGGLKPAPDIGGTGRRGG